MPRPQNAASALRSRLDDISRGEYAEITPFKDLKPRVQADMVKLIGSCITVVSGGNEYLLMKAPLETGQTTRGQKAETP